MLDLYFTDYIISYNNTCSDPLFDLKFNGRMQEKTPKPMLQKKSSVLTPSRIRKHGLWQTFVLQPHISCFLVPLEVYSFGLFICLFERKCVAFFFFFLFFFLVLFSCQVNQVNMGDVKFCIFI